MGCKINRRLQLQFHITGRCNLQCKHCYRTEGEVEPLSFSDIVEVIDQFIELKKRYNEENNLKKRCHVNITGGEPFCRDDIKDIIRILGSQSKELTYGVLSNGSYIDDEIIELLKSTGVSFVQLSIDGNKKVHDEIRAEGDYDRVFNKAEELENNGIRTQISFTANKENYRYISVVARECRKRGISRLWTDRLVPIGNGAEMDQLCISKEEMPAYIESIKKAQGNKLSKFLHPKTEVTMNRALQFINSNGLIYSCAAGINLITVDELGRVMPCRRMPIVCGDVFSSTLKEVYYDNEVFKDLRVTNIPHECINCKHNLICGGGARCQSYAVYGNYNKADPACCLRE